MPDKNNGHFEWNWYLVLRQITSYVNQAKPIQAKPKTDGTKQVNLINRNDALRDGYSLVWCQKSFGYQNVIIFLWWYG